MTVQQCDLNAANAWAEQDSDGDWIPSLAQAFATARLAAEQRMKERCAEVAEGHGHFDTAHAIRVLS